MNLINNMEPAMFSPIEMGMNITEWDNMQEKFQAKIKEKISGGTAFFFPGNMPSLKNQYEIVEMYITKSDCCSEAVYRFKTSDGKLIPKCSKCHKLQKRLKRPIMAHKTIVKDYVKNTQGNYLQNKVKFLNNLRQYTKPYLLGFFYVRDSKRSFDYHNAHHMILDLFRDYNYIEDDNMNNVVAYPLGYTVDPKNAGTYVVVMSNQMLSSIYDHL